MTRRGTPRTQISYNKTKKHLFGCFSFLVLSAKCPSQNNVWVIVPIGEMIRLRQLLRFCRLLLIVVTPAKAISAMRRIINIFVLVARLVFVALAKTEISNTIINAWDTVIFYPLKLSKMYMFCCEKM